METEQPTRISIMLTMLSFVLFVVFVITGVLNVLLVHIVPGMFYLILSIFFLPLTDRVFKNKLGFVIPTILKIIFAFIVLWGTLAVGDLAEILGL